jgi:hypothetical protein
MKPTFEIMIPKRIAVLRIIGWLLLAWALIILALFWVLMSPSDGSSTEMRTAYFIVAIPESVKTSIIVAAIILPIGLLILRFTLYYRSGTLVIGETYLEIVTNKLTYQFMFDNLTELQISAGRYVFFFPNISTLIVIVEKDFKKYKILLRHYLQTEELYQLLSANGIRMGAYQDSY